MDTFGQILEEQKQLIKKYEQAVKVYESSDLLVENKALKKELEGLEVRYIALDQQYKKVREEIEGLRWTLGEQVLSEKIKWITASKRALDLYFSDMKGEGLNKLKELEGEVKQQLSEINDVVVKEMKEEGKDFLTEINELRLRVREEVRYKQSQIQTEQLKVLQHLDASLDALREEPLTEEVIQKRIKQNNIEAKIGLHWINKIGVLLILIGIITVMRYSFTNFFTSEMKGIFGLVVGLVFLLGGEACYRKAKKVFALGLIGGSVGIFYLTLFSSYFMLQIINMPVATFLAVLVSIATFALCMRYNSRTIASFGLLGGYLPFLAYAIMDGGITGTMVYVGMAYILLLNVVTLIVALHKNWSILHYMSFISNVPVLIYLSFNAPESGISIIYSFITFGMYLGILLAYPLRFREKLTDGKIIILGANTVISCSVIYFLFEVSKLQEFRGLLALVFCLVYFSLSTIIHKYALGEKQVELLFNLTALTFAILMIPFQFGKAYISMGWLAEGVILMIYGLKAKDKRLKKSGNIIFTLCILGFYIFDLLVGSDLFIFKYTLITASLVFVLGLHLVNAKGDEGQVKQLVKYKYFTLLHLWIYLIYIVNKGYAVYARNADKLLDAQVVWLFTFTMITMVLAYAMTKIKLFYDKAIIYVAIGGYILADIACVIGNLSVYTLTEDHKGLGVAVLVAWNLLVLFNVRDVMKMIVIKMKGKVEIYPFLLSLYLLGNLTAILNVQFNLALESIMMSILYIIAAFILIIVGFKYRYRWIRYWGLGLCILATGKLFIFDFSYLAQVEYKVISYFSFGIVLLGISYLYQKFSKLLEVQITVKEQGERET